MANGVFDKVTCTELVVNTSNPVTGLPMGRLRFGGNELKVESLCDDPAKVRLAAPGGVQCAISFNQLQPDLVNHEEVFLIYGSVTEDGVGTLGGQLKVYCRRKNMTGDAAMKLVAVLSVAYTLDGEPVIRLDPSTQMTLGPFAEGPPPNGIPSALIAQTNLAGLLGAVQVEDDSQWLMAITPSLNTMCEVDVPVGSQTTLRLELRRTQNGGTSPYVYVAIDGVTVLSEHRPASMTPEILTVPLSGTGTKRIRITTSAQDGTVEIGAIRAL